MKMVDFILIKKGMELNNDNRMDISLDGCPSDHGFTNDWSLCHEDGHGCESCWDRIALETEQLWTKSGSYCVVKAIDPITGVKLFEPKHGSRWIDLSVLIANYTLITSNNVKTGDYVKCIKNNRVEYPDTPAEFDVEIGEVYKVEGRTDNGNLLLEGVSGFASPSWYVPCLQR
ncbi:hypothetical protein [Fusibacter sp. JL216-2]|uniref:hypothetical protein n=1 Tax=Fusibacter sp. JL216-2 TaxID=3071453 RepID=UPI003D336FD2